MKAFAKIIAKFTAPVDPQDPDVAFMGEKYWKNHKNSEFWMADEYARHISKEVKKMLECFNMEEVNPLVRANNIDCELKDMQLEFEEEVLDDDLTEDDIYVYAILWVICEALRNIAKIEVLEPSHNNVELVYKTCDIVFNLNLCGQIIMQCTNIAKIFDYFVATLFKKYKAESRSQVPEVREDSLTPTTEESTLSVISNDKYTKTKKKARFFSLRGQLENGNISELKAEMLCMFFRHSKSFRMTNKWNSIYAVDETNALLQLRLLATFVSHCKRNGDLLEIMTCFNRLLVRCILDLSDMQLRAYHLIIAGKFSGEARNKVNYAELVSAGKMSTDHAQRLSTNQAQEIVKLQAEEIKCLDMFVVELEHRGINMKIQGWELAPEVTSIVRNLQEARSPVKYKL